MFHTPSNLNFPHHQLLGCNSQETAYILPRVLTDKFERVNIAIWVPTEQPTTQHKRIHQRPKYAISPLPLTHIPATPRTIPHTMHEIVLLFINTDPSDTVHYGDPFIKSLDLQNLSALNDPSNPNHNHNPNLPVHSLFYAFCISPLHIFNNYHRNLLRDAAIRLGCPPAQSLLIPFTDPPPDSQQGMLLALENESIPSHNLKPLGKSVAKAILKPDSDPHSLDNRLVKRRGRPPKNSAPLRDKIFAAYTFQRTGAGKHSLPNGHPPSSRFHGGWPNPTAMLAHEQATMQAARSDPSYTPPATPYLTQLLANNAIERQARHNADLMVYHHLSSGPNGTPNLPGLAALINHPSTASINPLNLPVDNPAYISNYLTDRTISRVVEAISACQDPDT